MKKILIVCDVFPPAFAPRMGYLVKYLGDFGWDADILCEDNVKDNNFSSLLGKNQVYRVKLDKNLVPTGFVAKIWRFLNLKRKFIHNQYPYVKTAKNKLNKNNYNLILVSNSWNLFVLYAACEIAKMWRIPFIADLRDIHEQRPKIVRNSKGLKNLLAGFVTISFERRIIRLRNSALVKAAAITTVSPWHVNELSRYNSNINLIYNGYDPELFFPNEQLNSNFFNIVYTGIIIDKKNQDPTFFLKAIRLLKENNKIEKKEQFRIQFYVPERSRHFITSIGDFQFVKEFIDFFDYVEHLFVPELLNSSCLALLFANFSSRKGPRGVLPTKIFEYLGVERPVLCVRSDEGVLEEIIKNANVGVAARTVDEAYNFILEKWNEWNEKGFTTVTVNQEYKKQFSRKLQAKQFVDIFEKVIDKQKEH